MVRFKTSDGSTFDCELSMAEFMTAQVSTWIEAHGTYQNWREFDTVMVNPRQICYWWEVDNEVVTPPKEDNEGQIRTAEGTSTPESESAPEQT